VIPQDVVPFTRGQLGILFQSERCKRRRGKSAAWKSLQPISTFAPLLRGKGLCFAYGGVLPGKGSQG
jgi:hypothetical protein